MGGHPGPGAGAWRRWAGRPGDRLVASDDPPRIDRTGGRRRSAARRPGADAGRRSQAGDGPRSHVAVGSRRARRADGAGRPGVAAAPDVSEHPDVGRGPRSASSLQANVKTREGRQHPNRDAQFRDIVRAAGAERAAARLRPRPRDSRRGRRKAIPDGVYDVRRAADSQEATTLLITADAGGSGGARLRLWTWELQQLANRTGLTVTICHFPTGDGQVEPRSNIASSRTLP